MKPFHVKYTRVSFPSPALGCARMTLVGMIKSRREVGEQGERIASQFLERKGYKVLARNYRRPWGEIDLIAMKGGVVHFVEVKTVLRDRGDFSREKGYRPEELAHKTKLGKVARTAALYMEEQKENREFQVDVVTIVMDCSTRTARCRLFEQVIE